MKDFIYQKLHQIFNYFSSLKILFITIYKILIKIFKSCRSIPILNVFKIFTTIIFITQTTLLTIDYTKYEVIINWNLIDALYETYHKIKERHPSMSLCLKPSKNYSQKNLNSRIRDEMGHLTCTVGDGITIFNLYLVINFFGVL